MPDIAEQDQPIPFVPSAASGAFFCVANEHPLPTEMPRSEREGILLRKLVGFARDVARTAATAAVLLEEYEELLAEAPESP